MKFFLVAACLVVAVAAEAGTDSALWESFKLTHQKSYSKIEEVHRFNVFQQNLRQIEEHNKKFDAGEETYSMGVNQFSDMSAEEFSQFLNLQVRPSLNSTIPRSTFVQKVGVDVPKSIDWREKNAVTEIKNQGQCGGCWAFSTAAALEGAYALKHKKLVSFSEQQLIDCARLDYGMAGCDGGQLDPAFQYMQDYGLETAAAYPFNGEDGTCGYAKSKIVSGTKVTEIVDVKKGDEKALLQAVATEGPVSIAIAASPIQHYKSGIYSNFFCSWNAVNHAVLVVGYDSQNGVDYWIVKNSWGTTYGEDGYIRMKRNMNICQITSEPAFPKV